MERWNIDHSGMTSLSYASRCSSSSGPRVNPPRRGTGGRERAKARGLARLVKGRYNRGMATSSIPLVSPTGAGPVIDAPPPLENGDRLTRAEFERRYGAMPEVKKAELIEGEVHMPSPVRFKQHAQPHLDLGTFLASIATTLPASWAATMPPSASTWTTSRSRTMCSSSIRATAARPGSTETAT